ncbi:MAG TPA: metallophosphoesterase family protein [Candidatus Copromorpha excrementigallinarum]|uniref:Metallophosphoesterase family protein n=1 Tax=Candidatus Allocopromorpha excrementigallinarum TaxID=2840742 RepID=A0A9D1HZ75_9FIRM|nr:metallophosphoesterase family protein [Candidatus Copromorpha excrementigallinarum]
MRKGRYTVWALLAAGMLLGAAAGLLEEGIRGEDSPAIKEEAAGGLTEESSGGGQEIISLGEREGEISVSWKGSAHGPKWVRYGRTEEKEDRWKMIKGKAERALGGKYFRYHAILEDLDPGEEYFYETGDGESFYRRKIFTAPDREGETRFLYLGDVQFDASMEDYKSWGNMTRRIYRKNRELDFAVIGGDMVNEPLEAEQWNSFFNSARVFAGLPLMTVSGNHEGVSSNITYRKMLPMPEKGPGKEGSRVREELAGNFFFFDYGSCRLIMLDSSFLTEQRREGLGEKLWKSCERAVEEWLKKTFESAGDRWLIVVIHHPPYGIHDEEVSRSIRDRWTPLMERGGAHLVLSGHQHMYMRTRRINGIVYLMGNSGARKSAYYNGYNGPVYARSLYGEGPTYEIITVSKDSLKIEARNEKDRVLDRVFLKKEITYFQIF